MYLFLLQARIDMGLFIEIKYFLFAWSFNLLLETALTMPQACVAAHFKARPDNLPV
jgi:hypothetical protein